MVVLRGFNGVRSFFMPAYFSALDLHPLMSGQLDCWMKAMSAGRRGRAAFHVKRRLKTEFLGVSRETRITGTGGG